MTKPRIGSKALAKYILNYHLIKNNFDLDYEDRNVALRSGWFRLGNGISRTAYLGPDGNVYKIDDVVWHGTAPSAYYSNDNRSEWAAILKHQRDADIPVWVKIPEAHLFTLGKYAVMCMEVVDTSYRFNTYCDKRHCDCASLPYYRFVPRCTGDVFADLNRAGFSDVHNDNYWPQMDGRVAVVDVGL